MRAALIATAASLIAAAPAAAGTLTVDYGSGSISYKAAAGESNKFSITSTGPSMDTIQDSGVAKVPLSQVGGIPCAPLEAWKYKCSISGLAEVSVDLGDGSDTFDVSSASLAATVDAGAGSKKISTGSGNDQIFAKNGSADHISCGAGDDTVLADPQDDVASDCEHVNFGEGTGSVATNSSATPTSGSPATPGGASAVGGVAGGATNAFQAPLGINLPDQPVLVSRPGVALVPLACAATAVGGCRGDIVLELPLDSGAPANHAKVIAARGHYVAQQRARRLGARRFRLAPGAKATLPVRIRFRGHFTAVERRRRKRAVLKVAERDAAGKVVDIQTRVVTLRLSSKSSRTRGHK